MNSRMVPRNRYLEKLIAFRDTDVIKVVTGMRRCGKSTLLDMMRKHLEDNGVPSECLLTFKMESFELEGVRDWRELYRHVDGLMPAGKRCYLFFDELQEVAGWEKTINALRVDRDCDIYVTGSNAFLLSSEIATLISGRYVEIRMHPLAFSEYVDFLGPTDVTNRLAVFGREDIVALDDLLDRYLTFGGLPFLAASKLPEQEMRDYIWSTYQTIVGRDILAREARRGRRSVTSRSVLDRVTSYLADNISNPTSINKIVGTLAENGAKSSHGVVDTCVSALEETYIFSHARRFDIKGRDILKTGGKFYIEDLGLRAFLDGYRGSDSGRVLENAIYNRLVYDGYQSSRVIFEMLKSTLLRSATARIVSLFRSRSRLTRRRRASVNCVHLSSGRSRRSPAVTRRSSLFAGEAIRPTLTASKSFPQSIS